MNLDFLWAAEDDITKHSPVPGLYYVGRIRNRGQWILVFFGPDDRREALEKAAHRALTPSGRTFRVTSGSDPEWRSYLGLLYPDAERMRWIEDRRTTEGMLERGDTLELPRQVKHS